MWQMALQQAKLFWKAASPTVVPLAKKYAIPVVCGFFAGRASASNRVRVDINGLPEFTKAIANLNKP